jgi:hypothetical protein
MAIIDYPREIIVGTLRRGQWRWFVSEKDYWFLNLTKLSEDFRARGLAVEEGAHDRFGLAVVDENSADKLLPAMEKCRVETDDLRVLFKDRMPVESWDDIIDLVPALVVDFDERRLVSMYGELASFERYVPERWQGSFANVLPLVPPPERYWVIDGRDYLEDLICGADAR